jgi:hypothetical protein
LGVTLFLTHDQLCLSIYLCKFLREFHCSRHSYALLLQANIIAHSKLSLSSHSLFQVKLGGGADPPPPSQLTEEGENVRERERGRERERERERERV